MTSPLVAAFAHRLVAGGFDVVIFETGVGSVIWAGRRDPGAPRKLAGGAIAKTKVVARGPKPATALRELQVRIDLQVPEPNTSHKTLAILDAQLPVEGLRVAVQEYGKPVPELVEGLSDRGEA